MRNNIVTEIEITVGLLQDLVRTALCVLITHKKFPFYNEAEFAVILGLKARAFQDRLKEGRLPAAIKIPGIKPLYWRKEVVHEWLATHESVKPAINFYGGSNEY